MNSYKILIVEDEPIVAMHIKNTLEKLGYTVTGMVSSGEEAITAAGNNETQLVLMDIVLAGKIDGIKAASIIKERYGIPFIYLTAFSDDETINAAKITEPLGFIIKPFEEKDLHSTIEMAAYKFESEKRIKEIEKRYEALFDHSLNCIYLHDFSGNFLDANKAALDLIGYTKEELLGLNIKDLLETDQSENAFKLLDEIKNGKDHKTAFEFRFRNKNGKRIVIETFISIIYKNGNPFAIQGNAIDITQRKLNEDAASHLAAIVQSSPDAIFSKTLDGTIISWNSGAELMFGYSAEEIIGSHVSVLAPKEKRLEINEMLDKLSRGKSIENLETQRIRKNGEVFNISLTVAPIRNSNNEIIAASSIAHDITENMRSSEALKESEQKFRDIFAFAPIGIFRADFSGKILSANSALAEILGYNSAEEILSLDLKNDIFFNSEEGNKIFSKYKPVSEGIDVELKWKTKAGRPTWIELNTHTVKDNSGKTLCFQGFVRDINIPKLQREQLIRAKDEAEKSDRLKMEFLTQISHEIRTPLNNILTYTSILREEFEEKLPVGFENAFKVIDTSSQRLIRTIDLILNLSKIQTGNFETNFSKFDIDKDLLEDLAMEFHSRAKMKNLSLKYDKSASQTKVFADQYSLEQIFINLIDNAIKYTPQGNIDIALKNENGKICITVCDSGIGISKDYLPQLFNPFSQEESGVNRRYDGTGLGLALVKKYAEINNAEINVKSEKGKGTKFTVALPVLE